MRKLQSDFGSFFRLISMAIIFKKGLVYFTPCIYTEGYIVFRFCFVCKFIRTSPTFGKVWLKFLKPEVVHILVTTYQKAFIFGP